MARKPSRRTDALIELTRMSASSSACDVSSTRRVGDLTLVAMHVRLVWTPRERTAGARGPARLAGFDAKTCIATS